MGVSIKYGDYAPGAKENFTPTVTQKADFVDLTQLQKYNLDVKNYANPCEYGAVLLDGSAVPFPFIPGEENMGYWSSSITQADYTFAAPIVLTLTSTGQYSSQGFTFTFDTANNIFCDSLNIHWYRIADGTETNLGSKDFTPNAAFYFCQKSVENFNKVVITFNSLNMPYNRLKIRSVDYGYGTVFTGEELRDVVVIQEIDRLSKSLPMNVVDFKLKAQNDFEYSFQQKQTITVLFNDKAVQTCFVDTSTRTGKKEWSVSTFDYIGLLDMTMFAGDVYTGKSAVNLLTDIFVQANIPFTIDSSFNSATIKGHIPLCTCREAVKQICFAIGAAVDTSGEKLKVKTLSAANAEFIPKDRIMQGQKFTDNRTVTSVEVTAHAYMKNAADTTELYKASESGTGDNIFVAFSRPCYNLAISNGTIIRSSANYAVILANANCILTGYEYEDVRTVKAKKNPAVLASEAENIVEFSDFTLVSNENIDNVLNRCYNESIKTSVINLKIIEGKHKLGQWVYDSTVDVGSNITCATEYLGNLTGRIISERYNLNGGIIVKECEMI